MMKSINALRRLTQVLRMLRALPRGVDVCGDIAWLTPIETVFDVGANTGQSAGEYLSRFPRATIYCFEPAAGTLRALRTRFENESRVKVIGTGLGSSQGRAKLATNGASDVYRVADDGVEWVLLDTLDHICADRKISSIDFLKIDTEGHDLEVLKGAKGMLSRGAIAFVQVEAGMNPENSLHVPFEHLKAYLEGFGYRLFGIYEQAPEWPTAQVHLRRTNPVFASPELVQRSRGRPALTAASA